MQSFAQPPAKPLASTAIPQPIALARELVTADIVLADSAAQVGRQSLFICKPVACNDTLFKVDAPGGWCKSVQEAKTRLASAFQSGKWECKVEESNCVVWQVGEWYAAGLPGSTSWASLLFVDPGSMNADLVANCVALSCF